MHHKEEIRIVVREIRSNADSIDVAFSGGKDSTLVAKLCAEALGREHVRLINVSFERYSYAKSAEIVSRTASSLGLELIVVGEKKTQEEIWRKGPSCNRCTRVAKMGAIRRISNRLVATGANQSDSWGKTGIAVKDGFYAPIRHWTRSLVQEALDYFGITVERIGESPGREGCKLKHLLKMLINPYYHGKAVSVANELLLDYLSDRKSDLVNVKIVGPLSRNIALINVLPLLKPEVIKELIVRMKKTPEIDEVHYLDSPITLLISANPAIINDSESRYWIEKGRLQPEFSVPIRVKWLRSRNARLETFHVVGFSRE